MAITNGFPLGRAGALLVVAAGLLALSTVASSQVPDSPRAMTVAGCLVTERDYATARGLARPTTRSRPCTASCRAVSGPTSIFGS